MGRRNKTCPYQLRDVKIATSGKPYISACSHFEPDSELASALEEQLRNSLAF